MPSHDVLKRYQKCLRQDTTVVLCAQCPEKMLSKDYESHYTSLHGLNAKYGCVWCDGRVQWNPGQKQANGDHLLWCWRQFKARCQATEEAPRLPPFVLTPFNRTLLCSPHTWFEHRPWPQLPPEVYAPLNPLALSPPPMPFDHAGLNLAASSLRYYVATKDRMDYFQVLVRAITLPCFYRVMQEHVRHVRLLPFSCWCNGGTEPDAFLRQHKHTLVVAYPKGYFMKHVYPQIQLTPEERRRHPHYKCRRRKPIVSELHLANTIGYLSRRRSHCTFSSKNGQAVPEQQNHYGIETGLYTDFLLALGTQWDGGVMQVLHQQFRNVSEDQLMHTDLQRRGGRWKIRVAHVPGIRLHVPLPFEEAYRRSNTATDYSLHLIPNEFTYFEKGEPAEPVYLYAAVQHLWWELPPHRQRWCDVWKPINDRNRYVEGEYTKLETEVVGCKRKLAEMEAELQRMRAELAETRVDRDEWRQRALDRGETS